MHYSAVFYPDDGKYALTVRGPEDKAEAGRRKKSDHGQRKQKRLRNLILSRYLVWWAILGSNQ